MGFFFLLMRRWLKRGAHRGNDNVFSKKLFLPSLPASGINYSNQENTIMSSPSMVM